MTFLFWNPKLHYIPVNTIEHWVLQLRIFTFCSQRKHPSLILQHLLGGSGDKTHYYLHVFLPLVGYCKFTCLCRTFLLGNNSSLGFLSHFFFPGAPNGIPNPHSSMVDSVPYRTKFTDSSYFLYSAGHVLMSLLHPRNQFLCEASGFPLITLSLVSCSESSHIQLCLLRRSISFLETPAFWEG